MNEVGLLWGERVIHLHDSSSTSQHSSYGIKLLVPLGGRYRLAGGQKVTEDAERALLVPSRWAHQLGCDGPGIALFVPLDSPLASLLNGNRDFTVLPAQLSRRFQQIVWAHAPHLLQADTAESLFEELERGLQPPQVSRDYWVDTLKEEILLAPEANYQAELWCQRFRVSSSWFSRRFSQQMGVPLRQYVLWQRSLKALSLAASGQSMVHSALQAGFADQAHLSRTVRRFFGVCPSALPRESKNVQA